MLDAAEAVFAEKGFAGATHGGDRRPGRAAQGQPALLLRHQGGDLPGGARPHPAAVARRLRRTSRPATIRPRCWAPTSGPRCAIASSTRWPRASSPREMLRGAPVDPRLSRRRAAGLGRAAGGGDPRLDRRRPDGPGRPAHLLFLIWAATQTYADFDAQITAVLGRERQTARDREVASEQLVGLLLRGVRAATVRGGPEDKLARRCSWSASRSRSRALARSRAVSLSRSLCRALARALALSRSRSVSLCACVVSQAITGIGLVDTWLSAVPTCWEGRTWSLSTGVEELLQTCPCWDAMAPLSVVSSTRSSIMAPRTSSMVILSGTTRP